MSDLPFGFGPTDPDDSRRSGGSGAGGPGPGGGAGGPMGPFGFGLPGGGGSGGQGGFDMSQLGQMLTQLGQMLSQSSAGGDQGPINYQLAQQMAHQQLGAEGSQEPTADQQRAVEESVRLAELWLEDATTLPSGVSTVTVWSPKQWIDATLPTWRRLCDPVAQRVAAAWVEGLPAEAREMAGPMLGMMSQVGGMAFGSQLGSGLGQLAAEVLTSTEVGLPLGPEATAALLPRAVDRFTEGLDRPAGEVMVFLAAREAAHHRLFGHVPWLRQRLLATVEEFARGISIDTSRIEELARDLDPSNPGAIEEAMSSGLFEPQTTEEQKTALRRLETMLALVEGWVDVVVADAVGDRLPGAVALRETLRRRRASGGPAEQIFATLVGLELRPRRLRDAADLWRALTDRRGVEGRDAVWDHPDFLPTADDLEDPTAFLDSAPTPGAASGTTGSAAAPDAATDERGGDGGTITPDPAGTGESTSHPTPDSDDPLERLEAEYRERGQD